MARFDPREKELARVEGWHRGRWVEFVLTKDSSAWTITTLVDGDLFGTSEESREQAYVVDYFEAQEWSFTTFQALAKRFLEKEAA